MPTNREIIRGLSNDNPLCACGKLTARMCMTMCITPAKKAERADRANGSLLKAQRLVRTCPECEVKRAWPVVEESGNRRVVKCDCGHKWTTNVKRGEL